MMGGDATVRLRRSALNPQSIGLIVAVSAACWGAFVEPALLPADVQNVLSVFTFALVLWLTQAVPYVVSSALTVILLSLMGIAPTFRTAASGFSSSLVFFLLLVFLLGAAIDKVNLDRWFASRLLDTGAETPRPVRSLATNLLTLAFVMPSAVARATTFVPIVQQLTRSYEFANEDRFERSAFLVVGHVNTIASMALMTGGGMALVTAKIIRSNVTKITWLEWSFLMVPPIVALYALTTFFASRLYGPAEVKIGNEVERKSKPSGGSLHSLTRAQYIVGVTITGIVVLWALGSFVGLPAIVPAGVGVAVLAFPGVRILTAEEISEISWGILFVVGTMFSLLDHMEKTGTFTHIVSSITGVIPFHVLGHWQSIGVLLVFAVVVRVFFSTGSAAILIALPVILRIGGEVGIDQLPLALSTMILIGSTTIFPFNTTAVLVSKEHGPLSSSDVAAFGLLTMCCAVLVVVFTWLVYWPTVRGLSAL